MESVALSRDDSICGGGGGSALQQLSAVVLYYSSPLGGAGSGLRHVAALELHVGGAGNAGRGHQAPPVLQLHCCKWFLR